MATIPPPMEPSHDFLGDMRSNRRCLPKSDPKQYAPVSFSHKKTKMDRGYIGLYDTLLASGSFWKASTFSMAKGSAMYIWLSME